MKLVRNVVAAVLAALTAVVAVEADGVTLTVSRIQQRYPWNGLVDIDYSIALDQGETLGVDDNLEVFLIDKSVSPAVTNRAVRFQQVPLPMSAGAHRITWDANADGVKGNFEQAEIQVKIVHYPATYMVIDVSGGAATNAYPVDFVTGVSAASFNTDEYKKGKIALRRIHQGSYVAGSPSDEAGRNPANQGDETQHRVTISKPFYIGVFEVTAKQYKNVVGSYPLWTSTDKYPAGGVSWTDAKGFIGKLAPKCRAKDANGNYTIEIEVAGFNLPAEFQWEYACRAGTTKAFNGSDDFDNTSEAAQKAQLAQLGRYKPTSTSTKDILDVVGTYQPNAWGLYDMHGNVWEQCRDYYKAVVASPNQYDVDPEVTDKTGSDYVKRGGSCNAMVETCRSALRSPAAIKQNLDFGFRLSFDGDVSACERGLDIAQDLQSHEEELAIDLTACWPVEKQGVISVPYSSVGWGSVDIPGDATVRLTCTEGVFSGNSFSPASDGSVLAAGLSGRGTYQWLPAVDKKIYRVQHVVTRSGTSVQEDPISVYYDFTDCGMVTEEELLAAVQGVSQPMRCTCDAAHPWTLVGGDGDGALNTADGAQLSFSFKGAGTFSAELAFASGAVTVVLDGQTVETVTAGAQGATHSWAVAEPGAHTLTLTYSGSGEILVRNCAHADGVMRPLVVLDTDEQALDLREGVRTARSFTDILPFAYSSRKWTGETVGIASRVTVVRLAGEDADVTKWEETGPVITLFDGPGEGTVKWRPKTGVWKAGFEIHNGTAVVAGGQENAYFDLRDMRAPGLILILK